MRIVVSVFAVWIGLCGQALAQDANKILIVRTTERAPDAVATAIKSYAEHKKWQFLGASKVKKGEVTLVKICIPAVGRVIWPAGLQLSALLPCGNIGIYRKGGKTEIAVLHPRYMHILYPDPATAKAAALAEPLLTGMLDAVTK